MARSAVRRNETGFADYPTCLRARLGGGRLLGTDGSMWLYRSIPLNPVVDASSPAEGLQAAMPIMAAFEEIAGITSIGMARRSTAKGAYRQVHALLVNVSMRFRPPPDHPLSAYLSASYANQSVDRRVLVFGVRLVPRLTKAGPRAAIKAVADTFISGGTALDEFDHDETMVSAALGRAGLHDASDIDLRLINAWWTHGNQPDVAMLEHPDHVHIFRTGSDAAIAKDLDADCNDRDWNGLDQHAISFVAVQDFDFDTAAGDDPLAWWAARLLHQGAVAVSIRGAIEPAKVTRAELRRKRKQFIDDITEAMQNGKMERSEQTEMLQRLSQAEEAFAAEGAPPILTDASIVAALDGRVGDVGQISHDTGLVLNTMDFRQLAAMSECWPCSNIRANPHLHDLPVQTLACSGLPSISRVGDDDGAVLGFTEGDRQIAMISPTASSKADSLPLFLVAGATGSGKTQALLWIADQTARMGHPVVIVDPKMDSDHTVAVKASGGQVASLDDLTKADGVFDPLRFARSMEAGVEMASSMLMQVNPWGTSARDYEVPLITALDHGVRVGKATCIGEALRIAKEAGVAPAEMVDAVMGAANASPMFRACVGIDPTSTPLSVADGITLIKVGNAHLDLPEPGTPVSDMNLQQRVALALVRMMVFGSATALTGREGVVMLDEAWVFMGAGKSEMERLGRLARSQGVLPMMFTQRVSDATKAGLAGYISRGLILPIADHVEAEAACELFSLEATPERMARITARATIGGTDGSPGAPNWNSMRHLRDPKTKETLRGSIGIYADLHGRAVPVEILIPQSFMDAASTNPEDIARRKALEAKAQAQADEAQLALEASTGGQFAPVVADPQDALDAALGIG